MHLLLAPLTSPFRHLLAKKTARTTMRLLKSVNALTRRLMLQGLIGRLSSRTNVGLMALSPRTPLLITTSVLRIRGWLVCALPESMVTPEPGVSLLCSVMVLVTVRGNLGVVAGLLPFVKATILGSLFLVVTLCSPVLSVLSIMVVAPHGLR